MNIEIAHERDGNALAALRVLAMQESLAAIGRFDPIRARERFLSNFIPDKTKKVIVDEQLAAFYVLIEHPDHLYLDHLYVHPEYQGQKIGAKLIQVVIAQSDQRDKPIRLGALKKSRSNGFYRSHGFVKIREEAFDIYYERAPSLLNINSGL